MNGLMLSKVRGFLGQRPPLGAVGLAYRSRSQAAGRAGSPCIAMAWLGNPRPGCAAGAKSVVSTAKPAAHR